MNDPTKVGIVIVLTTFFLDLIELAFARIVAFVLTLRFFLYFVLHCLVSAAACFALQSAISAWYLLALVGTLVGVGVISNSDVKIAGRDLVPLATLFTEIKAKMIAQAAEEKTQELADRPVKAGLIARLRKVPIEKLRQCCGDALQGAGWKSGKIERKLKKAKTSHEEARDLAELMLNYNREYVKSNIAAWEA